jgi:peptidoglycan/LPS O-acetylase OafA/YrhL
MSWLSDFDGRRDNNFTLIRLVLASTVLFAHSYALTGSGFDPITALIAPHTAIQVLAVDGFFIASGFLVTASLVNRGPIQYVIRRALRIFPGYWTCLFICVVIMGPLVTTLPITDYFRHPMVLSQVYRGFYLFNGTQGAIPGAFLANHYPEMFDGSLWTLPVELRCYVFLLALGVVARIFGGKSLTLLILISLVFGYFNYDQVPLFGISKQFAHLAACFAIGALAWLHREWIPLTPILAVTAALLPFIVAGTPIFQPVLWASMAYVVFYAAFALPHVDLDRFGDISYGVYIYAWPIQQLVMWPNQSGSTNAVIAAVLVFPIATASWFLIEKPALKLVRLKPFAMVAGVLTPKMTPSVDRKST